jgi:uncharacterized membrane protein (TIGR02234 family)
VIRVAQLGLLAAAAALWVASRLTWVEVTTFDGLGPPKTHAVSGATWSTALLPLALLLVAAAVATLAVRGWPLRMLAVLTALASAGMAYPGIALWVIRDAAPRAARLLEVPVAELGGDTQRHYAGAVIAVAAAVLTLVSAVLLMRSAGRDRSGAARFRRGGADAGGRSGDDGTGSSLSARELWDALDAGTDPTRDTPGGETKGR